MKKKVIAGILAGMIGLTACSTAPSKPAKDTESEETTVISEADLSVLDDGTEASASDDDMEALMRASNYLLETIDEAEINKFVDAMYISEPQIGDNVQDIIDRTTDAIGFAGNGWSVWSEMGSDFNIELCNTSEMYHDGAWVDGRDNVCMICWYGYEFEDFSLLNDDPIIIAGNSTAYVNPNYAGAAEVYFHLYDKDRAMQVFEILNNRMASEYPDAATSEHFVTETTKMIKYSVGDDVLAETAYQYDEGMDCWIVRCAVYFETFETEPAAEETTAEAVETVDEEAIQSSIDAVGEDPSNN